MLEKYLNKEVIIEEKQFQFSSTCITAATGAHSLNKIEGRITAVDDEFIEIDNKMIISRKFIYRIRLK